MRRLCHALLALAFLVLGASPAGAVTLNVLPSAQTAVPLDVLTLDLVVLGLGNGAPPSLGAFDVDILYDPVALTFLGGTFDVFLGDPLLQITGIFDLIGTLDIFEISLEAPADLETLQPASFWLAALDFRVDVLAPGSATTVSIDASDPFLAVSDEFGLPLAIDALGSAVISNPSAAVPEPATALLVGLGLGLLGLARARRT